ncbi:MAG TPA: TadE/TadG family type IV pilus assembly protein [Planctomycetaceae bacterium]|nr:TadE/TadG family type IV pilus assembly protein [Planctomycetaceae bacterium]
MMRTSLPRASDREGACIVEFAMVGPIVLLLLIGMSFAGLATFRYIQLANVARHAARWAAVHGKRYSAATETPTATADDVYQSAIKPRLVATKPEQLDWDVEWSADGRLVTVTLQYTQSPEAYFVGGTLRSQCTMFVVN